MKKKAIVLLSGGLDSTVALWWALNRGYSVQALMFDYGQRHKKELIQAKKVAALAKIPYQVIRFQLPWSQSTLTKATSALPHQSLAAIARHRIPSTYVPGRNTLFLSFALSWADQIKADALIIGANALDYSGYPDCRPKFLKAFEKVASEGSQQGTEGKKSLLILAPLLRMTKAQIVTLGKKLQAPLNLTWSCYQGGKRPCRRCDSCQLRAKGFAEAGYPLEQYV